MTRAIMSFAHTKDQSFGLIEVFLGLQVHGMLSQMDPALVSYCEKIAENGGPLTLPEKIGGSVHVAQMETTYHDKGKFSSKECPTRSQCGSEL